MIIYYNPDCSKCKEAHSMLESKGCEIEIRNYLQNPPTKEDLEDLINKLGCRAEDLIRKNDPLFTERYFEQNFSESEWIELILKHPELLQRPIVIDGEKAVIGRPPVLVLDLLK